jgi:hypothetical protein
VATKRNAVGIVDLFILRNRYDDGYTIDP